MHIITRRRLLDFAKRWPDAATPLDVWYRIVKAKRYAAPADVKADFGTASFLSANRVVFNVGGGKYRLMVTMRYDMGRCFIRHVLTHREYDERSNPGRLRAGGDVHDSVHCSTSFSEAPMPATLDPTAPRVLRTARDYKAAVAEIDRLLVEDPAPRSPGAERLELLSILVEAYEDEHVPELPRASPIEVVDFMLEQNGRDRASLAPLLGGKSRVSEFFAGKRPLSINQVRALRGELGIPADLLID